MYITGNKRLIRYDDPSEPETMMTPVSPEHQHMLSYLHMDIANTYSTHMHRNKNKFIKYYLRTIQLTTPELETSLGCILWKRGYGI